jgi:N-acetylneuraminic acid mutarotase
MEQASVFKYDTEANAWSVLAPMPSAECGNSVNVIDGQIYIIGVGDESKDFLRFAPVAEAWSTLASTTLPCRFAAASFALGGCLYAAGGIWSPSTVERYDAATDTWTAVANMLKGRHSFGAITIGPTGPAMEQDLFDSLIAKAIREKK